MRKPRDIVAQQTAQPKLKRVGLFWFTADGRRHFCEGAELKRGDMHQNGRPILVAYEGEEAA